jgi:hypothetical protein
VTGLTAGRRARSEGAGTGAMTMIDLGIVLGIALAAFVAMRGPGTSLRRLRSGSAPRSR